MVSNSDAAISLKSPTHTPSQVPTLHLPGVLPSDPDVPAIPYLAFSSCQIGGCVLWGDNSCSALLEIGILLVAILQLVASLLAKLSEEGLHQPS